jgi:hypothetical protein
MSVSIYQTTRRHTQEDNFFFCGGILQTRMKARDHGTTVQSTKLHMHRLVSCAQPLHISHVMYRVCGVDLVRQPLLGLLYLPRMMTTSVKSEWELAGETKVLRENLSQCHIVHHKFHMTWD